MKASSSSAPLVSASSSSSNLASASASTSLSSPPIVVDDRGRQRVQWTPELHELFLEAVKKLGEVAATPKAIRDEMNVDGLTREHVASHLQKYRMQVGRGEGESWLGFSPRLSAVGSPPGGSLFSRMTMTTTTTLTSRSRGFTFSPPPGGSTAIPDIFSSFRPSHFTPAPSAFAISTPQYQEFSTVSSASAFTATPPSFGSPTSTPMSMSTPATTTITTTTVSSLPRKRVFRPWQESTASYFGDGQDGDEEHQHEVLCPCCKQRIV